MAICGRPISLSLQTCSPVVDCGVHYVDVMCLMTGSRPVRVSGIGARLTEDMPAGQINYGHLSGDLRRRLRRLV